MLVALIMSLQVTFLSACNESGDSSGNILTDDGGQLTADTDTDGDGTSDLTDNCNGVDNSDQADSDDDGYGDECDAEPDDAELN